MGKYFKVSVKADVKDMTRDLTRVEKKIVPALVPSVLNTVARRRVEGPAIKELASAVQLAAGVIRWKHDQFGKRTGKRRLIMARATRKDHAVRWLWAAKGGRAGFVSLISIPGRRQTRRGVRAGRHAVPSAFINRSGRSGSLVVLKRTSRSRYPIRVQRIPIGVQADSAFNAFVAQSGRHFVAEFQRRLTARLKRR